MAYNLSTKKTWLETRAELEEEFGRWGVREWAAESRGKGSQAWQQPIDERRVTLRWIARDGKEMSLSMDKQNRARDNFRVLFLVVQALRLNEARGMADVMREAYLQISAPKTKRDPYEVLGVRPDAPLGVIEASYKALTKERHPDAGGSDEGMTELNLALEAIKAERKVPA